MLWHTSVLTAFLVGLLEPQTAFGFLPPPRPIRLQHARYQLPTVVENEVTTSTTAVMEDSSTNNDVVVDIDVDVSTLPLPPRKSGVFRRLRDTIGHLKDPTKYVLQRSQELNSPVFQMYQFFKPVVVVGGQEAVREFITTKESQYKVVYPDLPGSFLELHTKWGALNLDSNDQLFKEARSLFGDVLPPKLHISTLVPAIETYVNELAERVHQKPQEPVYLVPELIELCLNTFATSFSGQPLTKTQVQEFIDYNGGLLALSKSTKTYQKGMESLTSLKAEMLQRFYALKDAPDDAPAKWYYNQLYNRPGFDDEDRIATGMVLFIWGAYIETASLMVDAMALMTKYNSSPTLIWDEYQQCQQKAVNSKKNSAMVVDETDVKFWQNQMPWTTGILRETLRLEPPGSGVPRFSQQDYPLAGYRIPSGLPVVMDPRIGSFDPNLFLEPLSFRPERWVPVKEENKDSYDSSTTASSRKCPIFQGTALKLGAGSYFPGGNGAHKCPGVPLAEVTSMIFLAKMAERFETWEFSGSGVDPQTGEILYVQIPVKICPDNFGLTMQLRKE
jgi:cytochrome P450